jgi:hypothetical protein
VSVGIIPANGQFAKGFDPRRRFNGSRPKLVVEIEEALAAEHRTVENMKAVFQRLKVLATEDVVSTWTDDGGHVHESVRQPNPAFMKLYLERVLGPVQDDASDKIQRLARELLDGMLEEARQRRSGG